MPKRVCPFEDDLSPQLKIHVGQRQYSNGVNKEQEMKKVYGESEVKLNGQADSSRPYENTYPMPMSMLISMNFLFAFPTARTLELLKKGGKEFQQKLALCQGDVKDILSTEKDSEDSHKSALKQMIFNSKLQLQASDKDIEVRAAS